MTSEKVHYADRDDGDDDCDGDDDGGDVGQEMVFVFLVGIRTF